MAPLEMLYWRVRFSWSAMHKKVRRLFGIRVPSHRNGEGCNGWMVHLSGHFVMPIQERPYTCVVRGGLPQDACRPWGKGHMPYRLCVISCLHNDLEEITSKKGEITVGRNGAKMCPRGEKSAHGTGECDGLSVGGDGHPFSVHLIRPRFTPALLGDTVPGQDLSWNQRRWERS